MSDNSIRIVENAEGWNIVTNDDAEDILIGPFTSEKAAADEALQNGLAVPVKRQSVLGAGQSIRSLKTGMLFRIKKDWYYYLGKDGNNANLRPVGHADTTATLPLRTKIDAVSVLFLK